MNENVSVNFNCYLQPIEFVFSYIDFFLFSIKIETLKKFTKTKKQ